MGTSLQAHARLVGGRKTSVSSFRSVELATKHTDNID